MKKTISMLLAILMVVVLLGSAAQAASKFPNRPITMVVQSNPGGLSDQVSQQIAMLLEKDLGVKVTCVYKPGAAGAVGITYVEARPKDGYTIGHAPIEYTMLKTLGYANIEPESCTFLGQAYTTIPAMTINAKDTRFTNIEELIAYARKNPGELKVGNAGVGSLWHLAAIGIEKATGVSFTHVPFEGASAAATALMGGHIDAVAIAPIEVKAGVDAGKLSVIAVLGEDRSAAFADVPTLKESGIDFSLIHWGGFIAPAGIPNDVKQILTASLKKAVESDEFKRFLNERAMDPKFMGGDEVKVFVQQQFDYFKEAIPSAMAGK